MRLRQLYCFSVNINPCRPALRPISCSRIPSRRAPHNNTITALCRSLTAPSNSILFVFSKNLHEKSYNKNVIISIKKAAYHFKTTNNETCTKRNIYKINYKTMIRFCRYIRLTTRKFQCKDIHFYKSLPTNVINSTKYHCVYKV